MLRSLWLLICILAVKKQTFVTEINLNFNLDLTYHENITPNETFIYSSLWITMKTKTFRGNLISLLMLLLLSGDIHPCPGPITIQEINNFCKSRGLKCFHQNIRGLQGKYDEVKNILIHYKKVDIFSHSEIFTNDDTVIDFEIPGYELIKLPRKNGPGGGVGLYIFDQIPFVEREDLDDPDDPDIEGIWIEIFPDSTKSFVFCVAYRPPDTSEYLPKEFITKLRKKIELVNKEKKEVIIMGDLNTNYLVKDDRYRVKEMFLTQLIETATLIDVVLTNNPLNISSTVNIAASLSDHNLIGCIRKMNSFRYQPEVITCRDFKNYDVNAINSELLNADWNNVCNRQSVSTAFSRLKEILLNTLNRYAPIVKKTVKGKPSPWLNEQVKRHMNTRDQLLRKAQKSKSHIDWRNYRIKKNFVKNEINRSKRNYFKSQLRENYNKSDRLWQTIKKIFPVKITSTPSTKSFKVDDKVINDKVSIAQGFCNFYSSVASKLKLKAFPLINFIWKFEKPSQPINNARFHFLAVSDLDVLKYLKNLKRKSATGLDNIPTYFLKDTAYVICKPLTHVINLSMQTGEFPEDLKAARVSPIFKSGAKSTFDNY